MSSVRWIIGSIFLVAAIVQMFLANMTWMEVVDAVNERLPVDQQLPQFGANVFEIHRLYGRLYPEGQLTARSDRLGAGGLVCFIVVAAVVLLR